MDPVPRGGEPSPAGGVPAGLPEEVPRHVAIIMDGNGRWALARGLPRLAGHRAGAENLRGVIEACADFSIRYLTLYAFSTENWGRPPDEVQGLLAIFEDMIDRQLAELDRNGVQLRHIGRTERLGALLQRKVSEAVEKTRRNEKLVLSLAFDYGGRDEIVQAVRRMIRDGRAPEEVDEKLLGRYLYTAGTPDPDLVIRTSGELRVSNFLVWQAAYAEWYFTPVTWPDFDREELRKAVWHYGQRERRFGRLAPPAL